MMNRIKTYFYTLLHTYLSLYIRPQDSVLEIHPRSDGLLKLFQKNTTFVLPESPSQRCTTSEVLQDFQDIEARAPDYIVLNGNIHYLRDIQRFLEKLRTVCQPTTRVLILYYSSLWKPLIQCADALKLRAKTPEQNWISHEDIDNLLLLAGFEPVRRDNRILIPVYIPLLSHFLNRYLAPLPLFRAFSMVNILVARPVSCDVDERLSVSVVVAARNEAGNIENIITRLPQMGPDDELIFVEGHSADNTWEVIQNMAAKYAQKRSIKLVQQDGTGKGDAVRKGFSLASKEILMILDADLTVPPEDLPKFYRAIMTNRGEFINGSRLVYPMEDRAMRFLNMIGNKFFALAFSFILGQRFKDTLCGTKVLRRSNYLKIAAHREYFGDFDPFGDFDLLFGASRLGLKIIEIPIAYKERIYGDTNIHRWRHGALLLKMVFFAARKMKFI